MSLNSTLGKVYTNPNGTMNLTVSQSGPPNILRMRISSNTFYSEFTFNAPAQTAVANITPPVFFTNPIIFNQTNNTFSLGGQQFRLVLAPSPAPRAPVPAPRAPVPAPRAPVPAPRAPVPRGVQPVPSPVGRVPVAPFLSRRYQAPDGAQLNFSSIYGQMTLINPSIALTYNYNPSTNQLEIQTTDSRYFITYNAGSDTFTEDSGRVYTRVQQGSTVPLPVPVAPFLSRNYQGRTINGQMNFTSTYGQMTFTAQPMTYNYIPSTNQLIIKSNTGIEYLFTYDTTKDQFTDNSGVEFYNIDTTGPPPPSTVQPPVPNLTPFLSRNYQAPSGRIMNFSSTYGRMTFSNQPMTYNYIPSTNRLEMMQPTSNAMTPFTYNSTSDTFTDNFGGLFYNTDTRVPQGFTTNTIQSF